MTFHLLDDEYALVQAVPADDLINFAAELDMVPPAEIDRKALFEACIPRLLDRLRTERVPLSRYDRADIEALSPTLLQALADLQGSAPTVDAVLKVGARAYRAREKRRMTRTDMVAYMVPLLLTPMLRLAAGKGSGPGQVPPSTGSSA